jgi:CCR4-NOT transcription complex subunit 1
MFAKYTQLGSQFNQKPFFRMYLNVMSDIAQPSDIFMSQNAMQLLSILSSELHAINPCRLPGFAFAWLEIMSHRYFLPKLLRGADKTSIKLLVLDLLRFLKNMSSATEKPVQTQSSKEFLKGATRIIYMMYLEYPGFLADNSIEFCNEIGIKLL